MLPKGNEMTSMAANKGCQWSVYCYVCPTVRRGESVLSRRQHIDRLRKTRQLCARHARMAREMLNG